MRKNSPVVQRVTLADFLNELRGVAPSRVRWHPRPGAATEENVTFIELPVRKLFQRLSPRPVKQRKGGNGR